MARTSLYPLIGRVRALLDALPNADFRFSDEQIQDALDVRRMEYRYLVLDAHPTKTSSATTYKTYTAPVGDWDTATALYDYSFAALTPDETDCIAGRWAFNTEPTRPVYLVGYTYDRYGAAADLLEQAAVMAIGEGSAKLMEVAKLYRKRQRPGLVSVARDDVNG